MAERWPTFWRNFDSTYKTFSNYNILFRYFSMILQLKMDQSETKFLSHNQNQICNIVVVLYMLLFGKYNMLLNLTTFKFMKVCFRRQLYFLRSLLIKKQEQSQTVWKRHHIFWNRIRIPKLVKLYALWRKFYMHLQSSSAGQKLLQKNPLCCSNFVLTF